MILFFFETTLQLLHKRPLKKWLNEVAKHENKKMGEVNIIFVNDKQLLNLNKQYLKHKTLTDIITFDYSEKKTINGDVFISIERVKENAGKYHYAFEEELNRVMAHGILHLCGYKDKKSTEKILMKQKEEEALFLFNNYFN